MFIKLLFFFFLRDFGGLWFFFLILGNVSPATQTAAHLLMS